MTVLKASQFSKFEGLHITAKKLLYHCNLKVNWAEERLRATGRVRLGPLTSTIEIETRFDEHGSWKSFQLKSSAKNYRQTYEWNKTRSCVVYSTSSKNDCSDLPPTETQFYDPLLILASIYQNKKGGEQLPAAYQTFSGNKWTSIQKIGETYYRKNKEIFSIVQEECLRLVLPQFRAVLELKEL